ncbi:MAG: vWA domain-containing protein [Myxococcota bacterium]
MKLLVWPSSFAIGCALVGLLLVGCGDDTGTGAQDDNANAGMTDGVQNGGTDAWAGDSISFSDVSGGTGDPSASDASDASQDGVASSDAGATGTDTGEVPPPDAVANADADTTDVDTAEDVSPQCNQTDPVILYLSADDSNSMASATLARGLIAQGQLAYKALRTYEFLNWFDFAYPPAQPGHVAVSAQMREKDGEYRLQIGVRAPDFTIKDRRRVNLVMAVDTSSSMGWGVSGKTGMDRARAACLALAASLDQGDLFSLVAWGGAVSPLLSSYAVAGPDDAKILTACNSLSPLGFTDFSAGLTAAYALAQKDFAADRINRVVLVSDGGANVGEKDEKLIAEAAKDADKEAIYLVGVGVGDPWNYNDTLMNTVTDAGKGAYVFLDTAAEAEITFNDGFLRHVEVAARAVQVELTLPPSFEMAAFHGEQYSTNPEEVEPQHLAANDAMIFHQVLKSCAPKSLTGDETITVKANWNDPITKEKKTDTFQAKLSELLAADASLLAKGDAVVAYAEALQDVRSLTGKAALDRVDVAIAAVEAATVALPADQELKDIRDLLIAYRKVFESGQADLYPTGGTGAAPIAVDCSKCTGVGPTLDNLACALDICGTGLLLGQTYSSPTQSSTEGTYAAVKHFGNETNDLKPQVGGSYALMATGPATGDTHQTDIGGKSISDPFATGGQGVFNAVEWTLHLKAPAGANGFRVRHVFFSQEYDEYIGSSYNDKFYMVIKAGSTNGGQATVINYSACRNPDQYYDFVCSPGMQFCNPRERYCYIAINTAVSECCSLNGCPNGTAKTDISGSGYACMEGGSSTGWLTTEWPIEPGEDFYLTFHLHDTGDGIYDSEAILDGLQFVGSVTPGTWSYVPPM